MADQNDLKDLEDVLEEPEHQLLPVSRAIPYTF